MFQDFFLPFESKIIFFVLNFDFCDIFSQFFFANAFLLKPKAKNDRLINFRNLKTRSHWLNPLLCSFFNQNFIFLSNLLRLEQENVCSSSESIDSCISDFSSISSTMSCYTGSIYSTVELDKILQEVMLFPQTQSSNTKISAVIKETTKTTTKKLKSVWNVIKKPKVLKKTFGHISSAMKTAQKLPSKLTKSSKSNSQNSDEVPFAIGGQRKINKKATKDDVKRFSFDSGVEMANKARTISVHAVERSYRGLSNHRNSMELIKKAKNLEWVWRDSLSTDTTSDTVSMFSIGNASDSDSSYDVISLPESNSFNGKSTISDELSTRSIEDLAELNSICCGKVKSIMKVNKRMKRQLPKLPQRKTTTFCENDSETSSVSEGIYSEIDLKGVEVGWMPAHEILDLNIERDEKVKFLNYEPNKKSNRRKDLFFYDKHNKSKGKSAWQRATGVFYKMFN